MLRILSLSMLLSFASTALAADVTYQVDVNKSVIEWRGTKKIGEHMGTVNLKSGTVTVDGNTPKSGSFIIDLTTINDTDLKDPSWKKKLDDHLKSADFFDVAKHPTATFNLKKTVAGKTAGEVTLTGDLTIKGKTKEISFPANITADGKMASAKAELKINRIDYDVKYNSASIFDIKALGDKAINDEIELKLNLVANAVAGKVGTKMVPAPSSKK